MDIITVGIIEDNHLLAQGIADKLSLSNEIKVILKASNGLELLEALLNVRPQVLLMDIEMDRMDGITSTRKVKELYPSIQVMMLTVFDDENKLFEAVKAGASGYLLKDEKPAKLAQAISELMNGGSPMSPAIATKVLNFLRAEPTAIPIETELALTIREKEVLEYLKDGISVRLMAEKMFVSVKTVHKHLEHIYQKLHVSGSREAVAKLAGRK